MSSKTLKRTVSTTKIAPSTDEPKNSVQSTSRKEPKAEPNQIIMIQDVNEPKEEKPKRKLSEKQLEALARGRAKNPRFHPKV